MTDVSIQKVLLVLPTETVRRLHAASVARNGPLENTASAMINEGIDACRSRWPSFADRMDAALAADTGEG